MTTEINKLDAPEVESVVDFINDTGTTMYVLLAHENPYRSKENQQGLVHWSCKILNENRFVIIYFSKGAGIRRWSESSQMTGDIPFHVPHDKIGKRYDGPLPPFESKQDKRTFAFCSQPEPPYLIEVLDVLARDIYLVEQAAGFEQWASFVGSTPDSRVARAAFDIVCQQRIEMIALLGEGTCHRLIYEIDRLPKAEIEAETTKEKNQETT